MITLTPFPARAGLNRRDVAGGRLAVAVPRTRGAEPVGEIHLRSSQARSPHARG